jgi:hypothetical protein
MVSDAMVVYAMLWGIAYWGFYLQERNRQIGVWMMAGLAISVWFWQGDIPDALVFIMTMVALFVLWDYYVGGLEKEGNDTFKIFD